LIVIPTAETVPYGEYDIEPQIDGTLSGLDPDTYVINTQFGVTRRLAVGIDFQGGEEDDTRALVNFQYLLVPGTDRRPAVAVGIHSLGAGPEHGRYLVATQDFGSFRAHTGIERIDDEDRWFIGADGPISDRVTLMADYTEGRENYSSVGVFYQQNDRFGIQGGVLFPNDSRGDTRYSLFFVFTGPFTKG